MVSLATGAGKRGLPYPECLASTWAAGPGCPASSFDSLVARHETLRTRFRLDGDEARQKIAASMALPLDIVALGPLEEGALARQVETTIARPFDLERGPLLRVSLLRLAEDDHVLVLVQHHIVSDGWSMQVMVEELVQLYAAYSRGLR
ncbi:condensation domain-containing protein [Pseudomonas aeruginosa]|nr:condensation domain-containing protein [Pseudomonas aeruginosa]